MLRKEGLNGKRAAFLDADSQLGRGRGVG